jgi:hypothetical protein
MRLWTVHPRHLDVQGLTAVWREGLLAQRVLAGRTRGYRHHPQLRRFAATAEPLRAIGAFLSAVQQEASRRGYRFDRMRIELDEQHAPIEETEGQLLWEWRHLLAKVSARSPAHHRLLAEVERPAAHPLFRIVRGEVRDWERGAGPLQLSEPARRPSARR